VVLVKITNLLQENFLSKNLLILRILFLCYFGRNYIDTHDNIENIQMAVKEFNNRHVEIVLHAGDFVSPIAVESFAGIKLVGILENNDTDIPGLTSAFNKIHG
jgi:hypothetical protein